MRYAIRSWFIYTLDSDLNQKREAIFRRSFGDYSTTTFFSTDPSSYIYKRSSFLAPFVSLPIMSMILSRVLEELSSWMPTSEVEHSLSQFSLKENWGSRISGQFAVDQEASSTSIQVRLGFPPNDNQPIFVLFPFAIFRQVS